MKENVHELHVCRHLRSLPDEDVSSSTLRPPDLFGACWQRELRPGDCVPPGRPGWIGGSRPPPPAGAATTLPAPARNATARPAPSQRVPPRAVVAHPVVLQRLRHGHVPLSPTGRFPRGPHIGRCPWVSAKARK